MPTILVSPKTNSDLELLLSLFERLRIPAKTITIEEKVKPNKTTTKAISEARQRKTTKAKNTKELFSKFKT